MDIILWKNDDGSVTAFTPPGGISAEEARQDAEYVPQDRPSFIADNSTLPHHENLRCWKLSDSGIVSIDTTIKASLNTTTDQSNLDNITKKDKAILLAAAAMSGRTPAQAKAAFKTAWEALAPAQGGGK